MRPTLLILGGTTEASALARRVADLGLQAVFSYAGRVSAPDVQPIPTRIGGFGGVAGLAAYLKREKITHLIDATHPFAAKMSRNAVSACAERGVSLIALTRAPWKARPGDNWQHVNDMNLAVQALDTEPKRIFLAIGRTEVGRFAAAPQHHYLLRYVDSPVAPPPLPDHHIIVARGPFDVATDRALLQEHRIDLAVSKNSGGIGAYAKIDAAGTLGLPVLMIDRPVLPDRPEVTTVDAVLDWLAHSGTDLGE